MEIHHSKMWLTELLISSVLQHRNQMQARYKHAILGCQSNTVIFKYVYQPSASQHRYQTFTVLSKMRTFSESYCCWCEQEFTMFLLTFTWGLVLHTVFLHQQPRGNWLTQISLENDR